MKRNLFLFIALLIVNLFLSGCKKKDTSYRASYTSMMGGERIWHGISYGASLDFSGNSFPYSYDLIDTFSIGIISDSIINIINCISVDSGSFKLDTNDLANNRLIFNVVFLTGSGLVFPSEIEYYYLADSIKISGSYYGLHGWGIERLKTP